MTERVDFYILKNAAQKQRWLFACRLTEKAYLRDLRVIIASESAKQAQELDDLLWTFNERAFVPHKICEQEDCLEPATAVYLTLQPAKLPPPDLLVNLTDRLPDSWERYTRIAEIIDADEDRRRLGRERFKSYRDSKIQLQTHQLEEALDV
jgi:DNA polymerase III subunit chi